MDLVFYTLQLGFFYMDFDLISKSIDKANNLFEEGGDWERKNRLKVYEGLYCMSTRNFKKAADLFLDSISTFTTYELFPYDTFIFLYCPLQASYHWIEFPSSKGGGCS
ncbi:26S PROTESOME SUBUNIT 6 [Salix koriyanagi]|uniref:26S PROTESOME SUBUNIT 6 n=1 Tax=Salix koriyanagi TaxID=2511006 RepID=A0A9Q1AAB1_9ROSI|nr:26S PROTESOME SUBUNIT 6 [Salix koriyanagi]